MIPEATFLNCLIVLVLILVLGIKLGGGDHGGGFAGAGLPIRELFPSRSEFRGGDEENAVRGLFLWGGLSKGGGEREAEKGVENFHDQGGRRIRICGEG